MKTIKFILTIASTIVMTWNGYSIERADTIKFVKTDVSQSDSAEYELIVLDPGYDSFLVSQPSKEFYSENYYKNWNKLYVTEWNYRYSTRAGTGLYETYIDYDPNIDYGLELEYRLYYYFRFFEKENRVVLIPRGK